MIKRFFRDEGGATAIEYALIAALISVAVIAAMSTLGDALGDSFDNTAEKVGAAIP